MADNSYRVVSRGKGVFDVEMSRLGGHQKMVPGFRSEHEAIAWIVQAKRMIREAGPWTPLVPRKPTSAAISEIPPAPSGEQIGLQQIQKARNPEAASRADARAHRERSGSNA